MAIGFEHLSCSSIILPTYPIHLDDEMTSLLVDVIHLQTWIPSIVQTFEARIHSQRQQLYILMTADLPPLLTDVALLEQILVKLLTQACTYTPAGELISVSAHATDSTIQISISSSGIDLSVQELSQSFDALYYISENAPWQGNSTELSGIQKLMQQLGAAILLERATDQTTFTLQFPRESSANERVDVAAGERIILSSGASAQSVA